jgi:autotransporter-associated beta strand protein
MERLEERVVLSTTFTWTGTDSTTTTPGNWSDAKNWTNSASPSNPNLVPAAGDSLVFPAGLSGAALTSNDDISLASGSAFGSLAINGSGYVIASTQGDHLPLSGASGSLVAAGYTGSSNLNLAVDFTASAPTVTVDGTGTALAIGLAVSGSGGLTKDGTGVLDLKGTNTYTGGTTVSTGALLVDGTVAGDVTVSSGATLGGAGTIGTSTSVGSISAPGATVSPGDSPTVTGVLTDTGSLTLDSSSNFDVTLGGTTSGTGYDQLIAGASGKDITLGGATLNVSTGSFNPVPGNQFIIVQNKSGAVVSGDFKDPSGKDLTEGATLTVAGHDFKVSYKGTDGTGQDVVLTALTPPQVTWSGTLAASGGSTAWSTVSNSVSNWVGNVVPVAGDSIFFQSGLTGNALNSNNDLKNADGSNVIFNSITVEQSGYTISGNGVGLAGSLDASQTTGASTISLPITFNPGVGTVTVDNSGASLVLSGTVAAPSGVIKQGSGTLSLASADNGSLPVAVDAGTLLVDAPTGAGTGTGAGNVTVNSGTTLGGIGKLTEISANSATVSPGDSATVTGILSDTGDLVLDSNSTFSVNLNGTTAGSGYDQLAAGGTINLGSATLRISLGSGFPTNSGQKFTIISNTGGKAITGTFTGLAEGGIITSGNRSFSISYVGGSGHDVVLTSLQNTTTTVSPVTTPLVSGQSVTLTATVASTTTGTGTPGGTVDFKVSINGTTTDLGTATLNSGTATLPTTKLTAGTNAVTATYSGDTTFATSTSSPVAVVVTKASTTTTVTGTPNPSVVGQPVILQATVAAQSPGSGTPTGTVTFFSGSTNLGQANLAIGVATLTTTTLPAGTSSITAVYSNDTNFTASTSAAFNEVINQGTVTVTLQASNTNPFALEPVTFTAFVSAAHGLGTPTGTVTFQTAGGTTLGSATLSSGAAAFTANILPLGSQSITAVFTGNSSFGSGTSQPLSMVVGHPTDLYVNQVYQDVFGVPAGRGATLWIALMNGGYSPQRVATLILQSHDAKVAAVQDTYQSLLGRPATTKEVLRALASNNTSTTPLAIAIFGSKEYYQTRGHRTIDGFLNALALDWFGAPFSAAEQARLAGELRRGVSRTQVARQVVTSPSGVNAQVNSIFEAVLQRPATAADQRQFAPLVSQGNLIAVYSSLFASQEFKRKFVSIT